MARASALRESVKTRISAKADGRPAKDLQYVAARLYLMLEALCTGRMAPGRYELDWADDLLDDLDVPEGVMDEAHADHEGMMGGWDGVE